MKRKSNLKIKYKPVIIGVTTDVFLSYIKALKVLSEQRNNRNYQEPIEYNNLPKFGQ